MENKETTWKECILALVILFLFAIGVIGGCGNLIYYGDYIPAIGVLVSGWLALPKAKEYWNEIFK
jgi:hypothetical protein